MRVLTAAEMREVDRRTISLGIPDVVLMENAGLRVVELLAARFAPLWITDFAMKAVSSPICASDSNARSCS